MVGRADASVIPLRSLTKVNAKPAAESCGESREVDVNALARDLPHAWATWLKDNFRTIPAMQTAFGASERTVRDWLAEVSAPRAPVILKAVADYPTALEALLSRAA